MQAKPKLGVNGLFLHRFASGIGQVSRFWLETVADWRQNSGKIESPQVVDKKATKNETESADLKLSGIKGIKPERIQPELGNLLRQSEIIIYLFQEPSNELQEIMQRGRIKWRVAKLPYRRNDLFRQFYWEKFWLPRQAKQDGCNYFFSLYQAAGIFSDKIKHLSLVHDVVPKVFPEYLNNWRKKIYYRAVDRAIRKARNIITVSNFSRQEIARTYQRPVEEIAVAYIACNPIFQKPVSITRRKEVLQRYHLDPNKKYIFNFGGFDYRKNIRGAIEGYAQLLAENFKNNFTAAPDLVLGGTFHPHLVPLVTNIPEEIKRVSQKYKVPTQKFKLLDPAASTDLPALYQAAEVFFYPSLYEGFGIPVLEAMWSHTPVVTSGVSSIPEVISAEAGYLINNPRDVRQIKQKLQEVLFDNPQRRAEKVAKAHREAQQFSWDKFVARVSSSLFD